MHTCHLVPTSKALFRIRTLRKSDEEEEEKQERKKKQEEKEEEEGRMDDTSMNVLSTITANSMLNFIEQFR